MAKEAGGGGSAAGRGCRGRVFSFRFLASLLYVLIAVVALTSILRYYRIRLPGLRGVWRMSSAVLRPGAAAAAEARRAAIRAARDVYKDTAIITLATGDSAAKHAIVLLKNLRDTGTRIPHLVVLLSRGGMGSADCHNETLRNTRNRHYPCSGPLTQADDIVSQKYLDGFARLGAEVVIIDPIPDTKYTALIPGGRATFWGMSFNKLRIFNMTQYRKIMFIDADVMVLRNIDHVMLEPDFTAAFTVECCNSGARAKLGGGMWIFTPSFELWNRTINLIGTPCPDSEGGTWVHADMDVVNYLFCDVQEGRSLESWPFTRDLRQGIVPGLKYYPAYRNSSDDDMLRMIGFPTSGLPAPEGLLPAYANSTDRIWRLLDARFDGLVGNCECMADRDMPDIGYTVHFSCMAVFSKPGHFHTDEECVRRARGPLDAPAANDASPPPPRPGPDPPVSLPPDPPPPPPPAPVRSFQSIVYNKGKSCTRFYYMMWYNAYKSVMGPYPPPYYTGPPVPIWNKTHDEYVEWYRKHGKKEEGEE
jgi:hypothetical protein